MPVNPLFENPTQTDAMAATIHWLAVRSDKLMRDYSQTVFALALLFAINAVNFYDRQVGSALMEPIRKEWGLDDRAMGALGTAFILFYAVAGVPIGRLADRLPRKMILSAGVLVWSLMTTASGLARGYWQLFATRLGVGLGEASCAPAATSLIGDLVPAARRGSAMSIFMLGLPVGIAASYFVSGRIAQEHGWRAAFFVAGLPGLICALAALALREPRRGGAVAVRSEDREAAGSGQDRIAVPSWPTRPVRTRSPYLTILSIPTMRWVILSGVFLNFNMYAIGGFLAAFLMRHHGLNIREAGDVSMAVFGFSGVPGLLLGGTAADIIARRRADGRLLLGAFTALASAPLTFFALREPKGEWVWFMVLMGLACALTYVYYSTVYAAILDVVEPSLRGTAMAMYFFAMYVLGAAFGPWLTGELSDHFTEGAAAAAGLTAFTREALEPFRAEGLRSAMMVIPILGVTLAAVLFAASRTVGTDAKRVRR